MTGPVLVTGGTGTLGRHVVRRLGADGRDVRVLSRQARTAAGGGGPAWYVGDLGTGAGLDSALAGTATIIHCASDPRGGPAADIDGTRRLITAAARAGVGHLIYISIVGIDRIPLGYYRTKLAVERLIEAEAGRASLGWTILRTTQFHDLVLSLTKTLVRSPIVPVPSGTSMQPVDADDVAARLVALSAQDPAGRVPDMGGPEVRAFGDLVRSYLRSRGQHRPIVGIPVPGRIGRALRAGANLTPEHADGTRTWEDFLISQRPAAGPPQRR
jgi:uncharacterized protein YbjT (DUF2867 family)